MSWSFTELDMANDADNTAVATFATIRNVKDSKLKMQSATSPKIEYSLDWNRIKGLKNLVFSDAKITCPIGELKREYVPEFLANVYTPFISKCLRHKMIFMSSKRSTVERRFGINPEISKSTFALIDDLHERGFKFIVAGGKVMSWFNNEVDPTNDFDLFFTNEEDRDVVIKEFESNNAWEVNPKGHVTECRLIAAPFTLVQIISKCFAEATHVLSEFDASACCLAYDGEFVYMLKGAIRALRKKQFKFINLPVRRSQFIRIEKYIKKGYSVSQSDWGIASLGFLMSLKDTPDTHDFMVLGEEYAGGGFNDETNECYNDWLAN
jgi:hypothetical protein